MRGPGLAACHRSKAVWMRSRSANKAMFFGARSVTMSLKPFQNLTGSTRVAGSIWSLMKLSKGLATCRLWIAVRSVIKGPQGVKKYKKDRFAVAVSNEGQRKI